MIGLDSQDLDVQATKDDTMYLLRCLMGEEKYRPCKYKVASANEISARRKEKDSLKEFGRKERIRERNRIAKRKAYKRRFETPEELAEFRRNLRKGKSKNVVKVGNYD